MASTEKIIKNHSDSLEQLEDFFVDKISQSVAILPQEQKPKALNRSISL